MRIVIASLAALFVFACTPPEDQGENHGAEQAAEAAHDGDGEVVGTGSAGAIAIAQGWAAETPGGVANAAGYLEISNSGDAPDRLISASSPRAARVEIHEMAMSDSSEGAMMTMRPVDGLSIPAGETVGLAPGGLHLMFVEIDAAFADGEHVPLLLNFEGAGAVSVILPVRRRGAEDLAHGH